MGTRRPSSGAQNRSVAKVRAVAALSLPLAAALAVAACSTSSSSPSTASSAPAAASTSAGAASSAPASAASSAASSPSSSAAGTGSYNPVTDYTTYIGGHSGAANSSLSPVDIGVINQQGGSADIAPEWTDGAQIAADYINQEAGGIDGHPVKIVTCFIPDVVSNAAQCGQQMANNSGVQAVSIGAVAVGNEAMESALSPTGKVLVFGVSVSPIDSTYKDGYILFGDGTHVEAPLATFIKQYTSAKTVSLIYPNLPGSNVEAEITEAALKYEGIPTKIVAFDPSTTNLSGPLIASGAATAGLLINDAPNPQLCSDVYKAIKQLNITTPVLANVPCDSAVAATGDGGQLPVGWYYASANPLPGDASDPSLAAFAAVADKFGKSSDASDAWVADSFAQLLTIAKWDDELLTSGKTITAANLNALAKTFKGPVPQGAPTLVCGSFTQAPAVCNDEVSFFQNTSPGVFKAIARWIGPPTGFVIPASLQ
jgi:branched-chain amino acid transport system substrate-binding protein